MSALPCNYNNNFRRTIGFLIQNYQNKITKQIKSKIEKITIPALSKLRYIELRMHLKNNHSILTAASQHT